ncbi:uncharacterized protein HaLaN_26120, partial [Haematococcus lacustris]
MSRNKKRLSCIIVHVGNKLTIDPAVLYVHSLEHSMSQMLHDARWAAACTVAVSSARRSEEGGHVVFGVAALALPTLAASAPWCLPRLYLAFIALAMPWRLYSFARRQWGFFLLDFCYFANALIVAYLLWLEAQPPLTSQRSTQLAAGLQAMTYTLAEGPLAAALLAWQCAWVLDSPDHVI